MAPLWQSPAPGHYVKMIIMGSIRYDAGHGRRFALFASAGHAVVGDYRYDLDRRYRRSLAAALASSWIWILNDALASNPTLDQYSHQSLIVVKVGGRLKRPSTSTSAQVLATALFARFRRAKKLGTVSCRPAQ